MLVRAATGPVRFHHGSSPAVGFDPPTDLVSEAASFTPPVAIVAAIVAQNARRRRPAIRTRNSRSRAPILWAVSDFELRPATDADHAFIYSRRGPVPAIQPVLH